MFRTNPFHQIPRSRCALAVALALGSTLLFANLEAGARERGAARAQPRGDYTRHTERTRTDTGHTRSDTWTSANGKQASREASVVNDREAGTRARDVAWSGPNGQTAERHELTTRTENGYTRESSFTNTQGKTMTRDAEVVRDRDAGTRTRDVTTTLPDGRTRSIDDVTQKTENGYTRDTTITNPNGGTVQRDVTATYDPATKTWSKDVNVDRTPPAQTPAQPPAQPQG